MQNEGQHLNRSTKSERRPRVPYSEEEMANLLDGVHTVGKHWNQILCTYHFHSSRTAVDLMEKYKRIHVSLCQVLLLKLYKSAQTVFQATSLTNATIKQWENPKYVIT